jgi:ferritin-like metal-binding protein YciE
MPAKQKTLDDLFLDGLKDIFHAEKQILRALPKMARAADSDELRQAFETHREETQGQIERLERVFEIVEKRPTGKPCQAMQGLVEEGQEHMEEYKDSPALDAALISAQQGIEHYEIARYGTLRTWAGQLGMDEAVQLLEETLEEEKKTDALLTQMAESMANQEAEEGAESEEDEEQEEEEAPKRQARRR